MSTPAGAGAPGNKPDSCTEIFVAFTRLALQGFGGVLPVAQRELVERLHWLERGQFLQMLSVAQVLPGPNIVNLALMIGDRFIGWRGAMAALAGILLAPLAVVLALAVLAAQWRHAPWVAGALRGMAIVAAGLVASTSIKLMSALGRNVLGKPLAAVFGGLTLLAVGALRWPLVGVVFGLGGVAVATAWWRARR